jgi:beta-lactamase regulating signal transducer with metallopeptidase domain
MVASISRQQFNMQNVLVAPSLTTLFIHRYITILWALLVLILLYVTSGITNNWLYDHWMRF